MIDHPYKSKICTPLPLPCPCPSGKGKAKALNLLTNLRFRLVQQRLMHQIRWPYFSKKSMKSMAIDRKAMANKSVDVQIRRICSSYKSSYKCTCPPLGGQVQEDLYLYGSDQSFLQISDLYTCPRAPRRGACGHVIKSKSEICKKKKGCS